MGRMLDDGENSLPADAQIQTIGCPNPRRNPHKQKCSETLRWRHCRANQCPSSEWKWLMTSFWRRTVVSRVFGDASCLLTNEMVCVRLFQVCNPRGILQVWLVKCVIPSAASALLGCGWNAGCTTSCPSSLCSHPTTTTLCRVRRLARHSLNPRLKMAGWSTKNKPPFFCRTKVDGPSPTPPDTPPLAPLI